MVRLFSLRIYIFGRFEKRRTDTFVKYSHLFFIFDIFTTNMVLYTILKVLLVLLCYSTSLKTIFFV